MLLLLVTHLSKMTKMWKEGINVAPKSCYQS